MKKQTQKPAPTPAKARRKSETLTLGPSAALALKQVVSRYYTEELAIFDGRPRDAASMACLRRSLGNQLVALACEAALNKDGSILRGSTLWKLNLAQMSDEESAAYEAMMHAQFATSGSPLEPISDAEEAAAIEAHRATREGETRGEG